ncbi:unnamed protein product [Sphagnum tenellum]
MRRNATKRIKTGQASSRTGQKTRRNAAKRIGTGRSSREMDRNATNQWEARNGRLKAKNETRWTFDDSLSAKPNWSPEDGSEVSPSLLAASLLYGRRIP